MTALLDIEANGLRPGKAAEAHWLMRLLNLYRASGLRYRMPMAVAILSVVFQDYPFRIASPTKELALGQAGTVALGICLVLSAILALPAATSWFAILLFWGVAAIAIIPDWALIANHTYLAMWCIGAAILFRDWWRSDLYATYLRLTLGIVMIAAFAQKIVAGTYVDGSYLTWLSLNGTTTERMFAFMCDPAASENCAFIRYFSIFILAWQLLVGLLLLAGVRSLVFFMVEIGFLLGAGIYADEMNFQVLNIAMLCIIFRYGMPVWLAALCVGLLVLDIYGLSKISELVIVS